MGAFFSRLVGKLLGDGRPPEVDHNVVVCCGNLTVAEHEKSDEEEREDGD